MNLNADSITQALYMQDYQKGRRIMAPNIHLLMGEQDFLSVTKAGYASEYEIKMSRADFKADVKKTAAKTSRWGLQNGKTHTYKHDVLSGKTAPKHGRRNLKVPKWFWFVVPADLDVEVPAYAGLIHARLSRGYSGVSLRIVKKAPTIKHATKLGTKEHEQITQSLTYRFWTQRFGMASLVEDNKILRERVKALEKKCS
jgi:hypothetical protein